MGTRATIKFQDEYGDCYYVYRGKDGFPDNIIPDIENTIKEVRWLWDGSELGLFVANFIGRTFKKDKRINSYELTLSFHGDESYKYYVSYNSKEKKWDINYE